MSKRLPRKKERNQYVHPNPRRLYSIMSPDEAATRPKEMFTELEITGDVRFLSKPLFKMTNLTSLYLNNNSLSNLPGEISLLTNLAHLNASYNKLRSIPPEIGDMLSLRELILSHNYISTLPTQLGQLFKLCKLELSGNPLGGHIMDLVSRPSSRIEDILCYLVDHHPGKSGLIICSVSLSVICLPACPNPSLKKINGCLVLYGLQPQNGLNFADLVGKSKLTFTNELIPMAASEYHLDTRIRRRHVSLITQQRRLRHLRSISARNIAGIDSDDSSLAFTLHRKPDLSEFYHSETSDSLNPSWKDFESSNFPEGVDTAASFVCVKIWNMKDEKQLLIEWVVFFSGLVFLGEQIPKEGKNFKPNTLIFGMLEGYYGCKDCYQHTLGNITEASDKQSLSTDVNSLRTSYTLSTLSRIKTVERAIKQTQAAVQRRRNSINNKLQSSQELHKIHAQRELLKIKISVLKTELQNQQKNVGSLEKDINCCKEDLLKKKKEINEKSEEQKKLVEKYFELSKYYSEFRETLLKTEAQLNYRRKELISELCCIYPVVEFPDRKGFSIHDVHLPNSEDFAGHDETMIAIALGYVCHLLLMISQFLNVPLRYSIHFYGSRSTITDHISSHLPEKTREFPLYSKSRDKRCFEYGVFLLNKNIAQLRIYSGLITRDLSATLFNLSSLIESRLSVNSEPHGVLNASFKVQNSDIKIALASNKTSQNGFPNQSDAVNPPSQNTLKPSESEFEILKREVHAMMPNSSVSSQNSLQMPLLNKDASNTLSCSLDKGLNDIMLLEKSYESLKEEEKVPAVRNSLHVNYLKQTSHHSSYPNLSASLQASETFSADSHLPSTPPKVWTAESSRTNSEDEPIDDRPKFERQPAVLNDSIFYIPSHLVDPNNDIVANMCEKTGNAVIVDDFTADLSIRAEQLANKRSSFQMQRLQPSPAEEQPHC